MICAREGHPLMASELIQPPTRASIRAGQRVGHHGNAGRNGVHSRCGGELWRSGVLQGRSVRHEVRLRQRLWQQRRQGYPYPPEFTGDHLRRLFYIPGDNVLMVGGSPGSDENACDVLVRYEHWSNAAQRATKWTVKLPLNDKSYTPETSYGGGAPQAVQALRQVFVRRLRLQPDTRPWFGRWHLRGNSPAGH